MGEGDIGVKTEISIVEHQHRNLETSVEILVYTDFFSFSLNYFVWLYSKSKISDCEIIEKVLIYVDTLVREITW